MEHSLAAFYPRLVTLFELLPDALVVLEPEVEARQAELNEEIHQAFQHRMATQPLHQTGPAPSAPAQLYLLPEG